MIFLFWLFIRAFARVQEEQETGPQSWRSSALRLWSRRSESRIGCCHEEMFRKRNDAPWLSPMVRADEVVARRCICFRCGQWTEYGTSMIDKCAGSDFQGRVGRKDPLHEWRTVVRLHVVNNDLRIRRRPRQGE